MNRLRSERIVKMATQKKKERGYFGTMAAVAPVFGAKALLGDAPRNVVKKTLERKWSPKVKGIGPPKAKPWKGFPGKIQAKWKKLPKGVRMSVVGGGVGIATAPLFLKGIQLASSDNKRDKMKGIGMIAGSGAVFQGLKGLNEGGLPRALSRISVKTPGAIGLGLAIAAGRKKKKGQKNTATNKYLKPALYAAAVGGVQGGIDRVFEEVSAAGKGNRIKRIKNLFKPVKGATGLGRLKGLKGVAGYAGAGAVAGGLGGLIASTVVDKAVKKLKD